jgi:hypothetical protein
MIAMVQGGISHPVCVCDAKAADELLQHRIGALAEGRHLHHLFLNNISTTV